MLMTLLTGCSTLKVSCDSGNYVKEYTNKERQQAADEMKSAQCPMLNSMIIDYIKLRDQERVE